MTTGTCARAEGRRARVVFLVIFVLANGYLLSGGPASAADRHEDNAQEPRSVRSKHWFETENTTESRRAANEEREDFIRRGLAPPYGPPNTDAALALEQMGPMPRFTDHPYFTAEFQRDLDEATDSELTAGNSARLLPNYQSWDERQSLIYKAQETLYVSLMVLHCDEGGVDFVRAMSDAAKRGVDTRLIVDGIFLPVASPCLHEMREAGVRVAVSLRSLRPDRLDWEMHEKYLIVDGKEAVTGGQNVGAWYHLATGFDSYYRDTDILLQGPVVRRIARRFVDLWTALEPEDTSLESYLAQLDGMDEADRQAGLIGQEQYESWLEPGNRRGLARFVAQDPYKGTFYVWALYQRYIEAAQKRVMLTSYALNPTGSPPQDNMREALVRLAESPEGQVDIITNGPWFGSAVAVNPWISRSRSSAVLRRSYDSFGNTPVHLWTYHFFVHSKQYYFDGIAVGVGSFNYDASGNRCQESAVVLIDPDIVTAMENLFALDFANATLLSGESPVAPRTDVARQ